MFGSRVPVPTLMHVSSERWMLELEENEPLPVLDQCLPGRIRAVTREPIGLSVLSSLTEARAMHSPATSDTERKSSQGTGAHFARGDCLLRFKRYCPHFTRGEFLLRFNRYCPRNRNGSSGLRCPPVESTAWRHSHRPESTAWRRLRVLVQQSRGT